MTTTHTNLALHLERHKYKRGQYKNSAPLCGYKRQRSHVRVLRRNDNAMVVRMYSTDILTAYEDGRIVIDTRGWYDRRTTTARLNEAFRFVPFHIGIGSWRVKSLNQTALRVNRTLYKYFDEIELDGEGNILSDLHAFDARHMDKHEIEGFREDIKESGFKAVFPVLAANVTDDQPRRHWSANLVIRYITQECHANDWPEIVARYAFRREWNRESERLTVKQTWARLMSDLRKEFMATSITDITSVPL